MKQIKRIICVTLCLIMLCSCMGLFASAATISKNKHKATGIVGGQTVYITSNTGWNTELFGNTYRTKVQINLGDDFEVFQFNLTTARLGKMSVKTYKKSGSSWTYQSGLSGNYNCNNRGYICTGSGSTKTFILPGKGVQYKIVISPIITDSTKVYGDISKAKDMRDITATITSYGTITKVG